MQSRGLFLSPRSRFSVPVARGWAGDWWRSAVRTAGGRGGGGGCSGGSAGAGDARSGWRRYFAQGTTCSVGAAGLSYPTDRPTDRPTVRTYGQRAAADRRRRLIGKECGPSATLPLGRPPAVRLRMWNVKCTTRRALLPTRRTTTLVYTIDEYISRYNQRRRHRRRTRVIFLFWLLNSIHCIFIMCIFCRTSFRAHTRS